MRTRLLLVLLAAAVAIAAGSAGAIRSAHAAPPPVVVTLGFDDGYLDQYQNAFPLLHAHGLHATFFVNTGLLGEPDRMSYAQLTEMAADGQEIAGHTLIHKNLKHLKPAALQAQICDDRQNLLDHGYAATSFAYPFGAWDADVRQQVIDCGYSSARTVSGGTESIPPLDAWATRTPPNPKQKTTVATLKSYVIDAQTSGGGWVQFVFHHACVKCDTYAITPTKLDEFLTWLNDPANNVTVKTTDQVIAGTP
jgi:peptidoglycan/xylan/chitin deacetylase (PgdA/CDA1 family)